MSIAPEQIHEALKTVKYPGFSRDIVSFGLVRDIRQEGGGITVKLALTTADPKVPEALKRDIGETLGKLPGNPTVAVEIEVQAPPRQPGQGQQANRLEGVKHVIAVASGKGGVGKSTFAVNLACALERILAEAGKPEAVGILDADIYGPSIPLMLGINEEPEFDDQRIHPVRNFGIRVMSMGLLLDESTPVVWRGPMVTKTITQFVQNVAWGDLEILVVDLPPGTGDAHLTLVQTIPLDGAVIVTTPQKAAVNVARRGATMFGKVNVPLLGVAENMSWLEGPDGSRQTIFGEGGGTLTARQLETRFLGQVPLEPAIREGGDLGIPIVIGSPESSAADAFMQIARALQADLTDHSQ